QLGTFSKGQLDAKLAEPAFSTAQGGTSAPIQGPFGWVILHVAQINAGEQKTFDQVKDLLRADIVKEKATDRVVDMVNSFEDGGAGGGSLAEAAGKLGLTPKHIAAIDMMGKDPQGNKVEIPADPVFLQQAFAAEAGEEGDPFESSDRSTNFAVKVT